MIRLNDHEDRLYELVDGILVEKTVGLEESWLAVQDHAHTVNNFVEPRELGLVAGEGGMMQIDIDLVRIPDVSFISWERLPGGEIPEEPIPRIVPDLAVEVISRSNTRKEMEEKLKEYFEKGVRLVWFVRPRSRVVDVYTRAERVHAAWCFRDPRRRRRLARFLGPGGRSVQEAEAPGPAKTQRKTAKRLKPECHSRPEVGDRKQSCPTRRLCIAW